MKIMYEGPKILKAPKLIAGALSKRHHMKNTVPTGQQTAVVCPQKPTDSDRAAMQALVDAASLGVKIRFGF